MPTGIPHKAYEPGTRFGDWTVICLSQTSVIPDNGRIRYDYLVKCVCGTQKSVWVRSLRNGHSKSCGCRKTKVLREIHKTHGLPKTRAYWAWSAMIQRCTNPKCPAYTWYGARGITVCDRWRYYPNFLVDMGEPPPGTSLDREDNSTSYFPENCRWATSHVQTRNTRRNVHVTLSCEDMILTDAAKLLGLTASGIRGKAHRNNISIQQAVDHYVSKQKGTVP